MKALETVIPPERSSSPLLTVRRPEPRAVSLLMARTPPLTEVPPE